MFVITGATGNTGRLVAEALLAKGEKVRAIGRSAERLGPLVDKGAEAFVGSVSEGAAMIEAFRGASAAYLMIPPNYTAEDLRSYQNEVGKAYAEAIRKEGLKYAVNLSSIGAHLKKGAGPISGLHDVEQRLNKLRNLNVVHLRAAYFMENFIHSLNLIKTRNIIGTPLKKDLKIPMIDAADIAEFATRLLLHPDFSGQSTRELMGPGDVSMEEATRIIGKAIGKEDLGYLQFTYEQAEEAMIAMGLSKAVAQSLSEMDRALNEGLIRLQEKRSAENTTPTTFEKFAACFAAMYRTQDRPAA